jgi:hypothetical protein
VHAAHNRGLLRTQHDGGLPESWAHGACSCSLARARSNGHVLQQQTTSLRSPPTPSSTTLPTL